MLSILFLTVDDVCGYEEAVNNNDGMDDVSPLMECGRDLKIAVQSDHATSSASRQHLDKPVEVTTYLMRDGNES